MNKKEIVIPALILTVICFSVTLLLSLTNFITADKIERAKADSMAEAMQSLVPGAEFTETEEMGYKSKIEVMTAVNAADGSIIGVTVTGCADESPGIGQKVGSDESFTAQYTGQSKEAKADAITGATFSSKAVTKAVNDALDKFDGIKGGN